MNEHKLDRRNIADIYPLTPLQEGILFHEELEPDSSTYWIRMALTISGDLRPDLFRQAWQHTIDRHPVLRTGFVRSKSGRPLQVVHKSAAVDWHHEDCANRSREEIERRLSELGEANDRRPPELGRPPLTRIVLVRADASEYRLLWWKHNIILDGWSWPIVLRSVFETYEDLLQGRAPAPYPGPDFKGYLAWLADQDSEAARAYWADTLAGCAEPVRFAARHEPVTDGPQGRRRIQVSTEDSDCLRRYAKAHRITPNTLIQGAWALAIGIEVASTDVVFGAALALRNTDMDRIEDMVGMTLATIPIRVNVEADAPIGDWLRAQQARFQESVQHAHLPLTDIMACGEFSAGDTPFESVVVFENFPFETGLTGRCTSLEVGDLEAAEGTQFPLTLTVLPLANFAFELAYRRDRIDENHARRIFERFLHIVTTIAAGEASTVGDIDRLLPGERTHLLTHLRGRSPERRRESTLDLIAARVRQGASRTAVVFGSSEMTYGDLWASSRAVADALMVRGIKRGDLVGIGMRRSADLVTVILGVWQAGAAYVPLDPALPAARIETIATLADLDLIVTDRDTASRFSAFHTPLADANELLTAGDPDRRGEAWVSDPRAYVMFTSGSTGTPNGVQVLHDGVVNLLESMRREPGCTERDRLLAVTTIAFDISVLELFLPLISGGTTIIAGAEDASDGKALSELLERSRATLMQATPSTWTMLLQSGWAGSPGLRALCGGEPMGTSLAGALLPRVASLWNLYGPTETTIWSTCARISDGNAVQIGGPIDHTELRVLDLSKSDVPCDVVGELYIGGRGVSGGYLDNAELTAARFLDLDLPQSNKRRWFRTGDLVSLSANGELRFHGRIDNQLKVRGFRIEAGDIESHLVDAPGVRSVAVTKRVGPGGDDRLVAFVVPAEQQHVDATALRDHLRDRVPRYMIPQHFVAIDALPLTPNRKIDYRRLPQLGRDVAGGGQGGPPQTATEKRVAVIWRELLGVDAVSAAENFFEVGGHSLLLARLARRMELAFERDFSLADLMQDATVAGHAKLAGRDAHEPRGEIAVAADRDRFPMSSIQTRLWFLEQFEASAGVHNLAAVYRLQPDVGLDRLRQAFNDLAQRHEILRTVFMSEAGEPFQHVLEDAVVDWTYETPDDRMTLEQRLASQAAQGFDPGAKPPWRVYVARFEGEYWLLLAVHHMLLDAESLRLLFDELGARYEGRPCASEVLQYGDFAAWQQARLVSGEYDGGLAFWTSELGGPLPVLQFPSFVSRPPEQNFAGDTRSLALEEPISGSLRRLAADCGTSVFNVLLAAYCAVLLRYCRQDAVVVGTPVGTIRYEIGADTALGPYINTVALHLAPESDSSFGALVDTVSAKSAAALRHANVPFEEVVRSLTPTVDVSRTPVFQTLFGHDSDLGPDRMPGFCAAPEPVPWTRARTDIACWVMEHEGQIRIEIEYATALFAAPIIEGFLRHLERFLEAVSAHPEHRWRQVSILSDDEIRSMIGQPQALATGPGDSERNEPARSRNATAVPYPADSGVHALFTRQAQRSPDALAVRCGATSLTYGELDARSNQLAHYLQGQGVGPGTLVGICLERSPEMLVALFGVLKAGAAYVPLDPSFPQDRLGFMAGDAAIGLLLTQEALRETVPAYSGPVLCLDSQWDAVSAQDRAAVSPAQGPDDLAYVIYTSGSTGKPKGVQIPHRALTNFLCSMRERPGMTAEDCLLAVTTLSFDIAALELYLPLVTGARVVVASREEATDGVRLGELVASSGASVMQATPSTWRLLLESGWGGVAGLKVLCGGEALPRDLAEQILSLGMDLWNLYGPTETTIWSAVERVTRGEGPVSIGRPIGNTRLYVLDDEQALVPDGVVGELYIGGDGLARGYLNRPELTAERFVSSPFVAGERLYRTGDLARYRPDGRLEVLGRTDHQVKVRGYRIELGEIEAGLLSHPDVAAAVALVREDGPGDRRIVAYVVAAHGAEVDGAALREHLKASLPDYMLPTAFVALEAFPLTPNNKVDRQALPAPEGGLASVAEYVAPEGDVETGLAAIWAETLGLERVGVNDDFFELGGHSLLTVRLVADIDRRMGLSLPLAAVFQGRTIRGILAIAGDSGKAEQLNLKALVPLREAGRKLPFYAGGSHPGYREVAEHLDRDRPFYRMDIYSLQQSRVMQGLSPLRTIEDMASVFIDEIRAVQPGGPYHLGGGCEGGMVAFEVARQLQAAGEEVHSLVIWVVQAPQLFDKPSRLRTIKRVVLHVLGQMVGERGNRFRWRDLAPTLRHEYVQYLIYGAMESYRPDAPYRGDLVLARHDLPGFPEDGDASLGWQSLVTGSVTVHTLPGDHSDWLNQHASALGRLLDDLLATDGDIRKAS